MAEAILPILNHDHIRVLFGPRDAFIRRIRDVSGASIVLRGDELRLQGSEDGVAKALEILRSLLATIERTSQLTEDVVERLLNDRVAETEVVASAQTKNESDSARSSAKRGRSAAEDGETSDEERASDRSINVFEKAKRVKPRTPGQAAYIDTVTKNDLVFCIGPAGCGKTYLAVAMAINALRSERVRKIVLVRPAVEAGERLGFLPGDLLAKVNPYLRPLLDALHDILDYEQVKRYMEHDVIEIVPLAFMRGRTLNDTFIILDEGQNTTITQMKMFLTRMGEGSKIVVTGDTTQVDLPHDIKSGMSDAVRRLGRIQQVGVVRLSGDDIVRHRLVREIVKAYDSEKPRK